MYINKDKLINNLKADLLKINKAVLIELGQNNIEYNINDIIENNNLLNELNQDFIQLEANFNEENLKRFIDSIHVINSNIYNLDNLLLAIANRYDLI